MTLFVAISLSIKNKSTFVIHFRLNHKNKIGVEFSAANALGRLANPSIVVDQHQ